VVEFVIPNAAGATVSFPVFILGWTNGGMNLVLTPALTFYPLPQERKWLLDGSGLADGRPANPVARIFKATADDSPSPWGEGRDEGGRETNSGLVAPTRRTKFGDDGNQIGAHSAFRIPHWQRTLFLNSFKMDDWGNAACQKSNFAG
jgi:hypothetical protein